MKILFLKFLSFFPYPAIVFHYGFIPSIIYFKINFMVSVILVFLPPFLRMTVFLFVAFTDYPQSFYFYCEYILTEMFL